MNKSLNANYYFCSWLDEMTPPNIYFEQNNISPTK